MLAVDPVLEICPGFSISWVGFSVGIVISHLIGVVLLVLSIFGIGNV